MRMDAQLQGQSESIGQRMVRDLDALLPLPATAYDVCDKQASRVPPGPWCATAPTTTRCWWPTDIRKCWSEATWLRW